MIRPGANSDNSNDTGQKYGERRIELENDIKDVGSTADFADF